MATNNTDAAVWFLYICKAVRSGLYVGIAKDVAKRVAKHGGPKGAKYLRGKGKSVLLWKSTERHTLSDALRREAAMKAARRQAKERFLHHENNATAANT